MNNLAIKKYKMLMDQKLKKYIQKCVCWKITLTVAISLVKPDLCTTPSHGLSPSNESLPVKDCPNLMCAIGCVKKYETSAKNST